jgi:universal stress protein A
MRYTFPSMLASRILVPVDLSEFAERAAVYAAELARLTQGEMTFLTVVNDVFPYFDFFPVDYATGDYIGLMTERAEEKLREIAERCCPDSTSTTVVVRGYPAAEIVEYARANGFDLIVMASHGHSGIEHALLGSISEKVLRKAHCPVLIVR